ncbi:glycosyltransferase [Mycolicibacterium pulveris]|uniref:glycosyltransferase n=1 Tax=Mycolicibacterium pulveris TaxID=36813 RepID=UPI003CECECCB
MRENSGGIVRANVKANVRVVGWPRWFSNPYLPKLLAALRDEGVDASASYTLVACAARLRAGDWLHLHWPGEAHTHKVRWLYRLHAATVRMQLRALKRRGVRIAWTAHNLVPHDDPHPDLGHRARRDVLALVDHVFVHFASARADLAETFGYTGPSTVMPHPHFMDTYPPPAPRDVARARLGLPDDGFVCLAFGRIRPYKGIGSIISAFRAMAGERDRLVVAGLREGDVNAELALAEGDPRILVHARKIPHDDVPLYFGAADVAVTAHRAFFTSGTAPLALTMGCPIVGPSVHHLAELAGGQRVFPIQDGPDGLAASLAQARDAAPTIDHAALRAWTADCLGDWHDAAAQICRVFRC